MFQNLASSIKSFLDAPFRQEMSATEIFLLIGLVMVAIILWTRILHFIEHEVAEV